MTSPKPRLVSLKLGDNAGHPAIHPMIKKALISAGFEDVPVVTLSTNLQTLNDQPGFEFDIKEYMYKAVVGMMFTDALSDMYYSSAIREVQKGSAQGLVDDYLKSFHGWNHST